MKTPHHLSLLLASLAFVAIPIRAAKAGDDITWHFEVANGEARITRPAISKETTGSIAIPSRLGGYPVTRIGGWAFDGCSGLTSVTIPDSVRSIGEGAFYDCSGLTSVRIPDSVTSIGCEAFDGCDSLLDTSTIPGVWMVDGWVVDNEWTLPPSGALDLTGVRGIGDFALGHCTGLTSITIPDSVTSIGSTAFYDCSGLTSLTIPDSVTHIGDGAFDFCSGLISLSLPKRFEGNTSNMGIRDSCTVTFRANAHRYEVVLSRGITWTEARNAAIARGGHLATVTSSAEWALLESQCELDNYLWLGGTDKDSEGDWTWVTGEAWSYSRWYVTQPDNYRSNQHYLLQVLGDWDDESDRASAYTMAGYIVEYCDGLADVLVTPCVPGRFDGDGKADIAVYNGGTWMIEASTLGRSSTSFGSGDCIPVPADYDGDGTTDLSVYDTVTGDWWIRYSTGLNGRSWICDNFGSLTCKPFPADYDGDGLADLSVWDGRTGDWFIRFSTGGWKKDNFGSLSCIPVPADYDGDGKADLSVRDNATGDWWIRYTRGLNGRSWLGDNFGSTVCDPYPADYDGDGKADLSVYDQQTGDWFVRFSGGGWTKDNFGMKTCIPVPADYDGDGRADFAVYDTATFTFWARYSGGGWTSTDF